MQEKREQFRFQKIFLPGNGAVDKTAGAGYNAVTRGCQQTAHLGLVKRGNSYFGERQLFLFAFRIHENSEDKDTELNQVGSCNAHICYSPSLSIGGKDLSPDG